MEKCMFSALLPDCMWLEAEVRQQLAKSWKKQVNWFIIAQDDTCGWCGREEEEEIFLHVSFLNQKWSRKFLQCMKECSTIPCSVGECFDIQHFIYGEKSEEEPVVFLRYLSPAWTFTKLISFPVFDGKLIFHWEITKCKYLTWYTRSS